MRARLLLAAAAVAVTAALPAAPASAIVCYELPTGHCVSPCGLNNSIWDRVAKATNDKVDGPRCYN